MLTALFTKEYETPAAATAAARHHRWLATYAQPLRLPSLRIVGPTTLAFEHVDGRHAAKDDLTRLAQTLGDAHGAAWAGSLCRARLDTPYTFEDGQPVGDFLSSRRIALHRRLERGYLPGIAALRAMLTILERNAEGPAAFYKDSNPRNFLFTDDGALFGVDTDDLTLAPFGYDLAKLIVTLIMTYGPLGSGDITEALARYNRAAARHDARLGVTTRERLDDFLTLHSVLTAPYVGRHGYRYGWPYRHTCAPTGGLS